MKSVSNPASLLKRVLVLSVLVLNVRSIARAGVVYEVYKVAQGETMEAIAARFNTTTDHIRTRNGLAPDSQIYVGQSLVIPVGARGNEQDPAQGTYVSHTNAAPPPPPRAKPNNQRVVGRLGTVVARGARIRSTRSGSARTYYAPSTGMQLVVTRQSGDWLGVLMSNGATGWVPAKYVRVESVELVSRFPEGGGSAAGSVVQEAYRYLGVPYHYGGNGAGGIDCSALIKRTYLASRGVNLPRTAAQQARVGAEVPVNQLEAGDRLYFSRSGSRIDHCGIYLGNGQFIHASGAARGVTVNSLYEQKYWNWFRVARR